MMIMMLLLRQCFLCHSSCLATELVVLCFLLWTERLESSAVTVATRPAYLCDLAPLSQTAPSEIHGKQGIMPEARGTSQSVKALASQNPELLAFKLASASLRGVLNKQTRIWSRSPPSEPFLPEPELMTWRGAAPHDVAAPCIGPEAIRTSVYNSDLEDALRHGRLLDQNVLRWKQKSLAQKPSTPEMHCKEWIPRKTATKSFATCPSRQTLGERDREGRETESWCQ